MPVGERVHVVGVVLEGHAGRVVVDEEERRPTLVAVDDEAVEDHEVGLVGRPGHEPLLAVQDVLAGRRVADGGGRQGPRIGAGAGLGDGVAAEALAAQRRLQVAPALLGVAVDERVVGARDERPRPAGRLAELLVDEDLLDGRPALAAGLDRQRAADQPGRDARRRGPRPGPRAGSRPPPRSRSSSSGWRTSTTNARARAWSSSWAGVRVASIAAKDAPAGGAARRGVAVGGTPPRGVRRSEPRWRPRTSDPGSSVMSSIGPAQALAAEARVLDPAVGHVVDAVGRDVVDDDPAENGSTATS